MPTWSHSRLAAFESCPLKYYYTYVEKPDLEEVLGDNIALVLGRSVHEALEELYKRVSATETVSKKDLAEIYERAWAENYSDDAIVPQYDAMTWKSMGEKQLSDYFKSYSPFDQERTIALERMIRLKLGKYTLIGYIDRISESVPGHYQIRDYKTNKYLQTQEKFDNDRQLALYEIGLRQMFKDVKSVDLIWHMLHFNKEVKSKRTPLQLAQLKMETIGKIREIEREEDYLPKESRLCEWCSFQDICPKKKHERSLGKLKPKQFRKDEGVKLANKFIQTKLKMNEWGIKNAEARKDIMAYSKQHNETKLIGSSAAISISSMRRVSFDPKAEKILKKAGLWDEFSKLDTSALNKALKGLEPKIRKRLEKLEKVTETTMVRVGKK